MPLGLSYEELMNLTDIELRDLGNPLSGPMSVSEAIAAMTANLRKRTVQAIEANNRQIEHQLRQAGIPLD